MQTPLPLEERAVMQAIERRLRMGLKQYGPLDIRHDPRRWTKEALEEALDGMVYLAIALISRELRTKKKPPKKKKAAP